MASKHISLPSTFAEGDPTEWFQRFDICCRANDWNDETKAKKLPRFIREIDRANCPGKVRVSGRYPRQTIAPRGVTVGVSSRVEAAAQYRPC